jgi:hypothetical protein
MLVSRTVKDLVVGSGLEFDSRGIHELKALASGGAPTVPVVPEEPHVRATDRVVLATARRAPALLRLTGRIGRS